MSGGRRKEGTVNTGHAEDYILLKAEAYANKVLKGSRQMDEFNYGNDIIRPPYEPRDLIALIERNDSLKQNIEALAANVANFGHGIKYQDDFDYSKSGKDIQKQADTEWESLRRLYKYVNPLLDFGALIYKMAIDMYSFGWGMLEVIRNGLGEVCSVEYCRACNFRISQNKNPYAVLNIWEETESGYEQTENFIKFKRFVQIVNGKKIYFKEFGDPRPMSSVTGEYGESLQKNEIATEIAYFHIHSSYTDYGVPYWINTAITASGNVMSELLNYKYFHDGKILPMAILVNGGQLTEASAETIRQGKGLDNAYKAIVLEAAPFEDTSSLDEYLKKDKDAKVSIDIKSLTDTTNKDALFRNYQLDGKEKIRDSMRLPPIYTGASSDYTRATAETARQIAEEQIFIPERKRICGIFNKIINNEKGARYCELYLKGPDLGNIEQKAKIIESLDKAGVVTPNMLLPVAEEVLGKDIEPWNDKLGNMPFELIKLLYQTSSASENNVEKSDSRVIDELNKLTDLIELELGGGADD